MRFFIEIATKMPQKLLKSLENLTICRIISPFCYCLHLDRVRARVLFIRKARGSGKGTCARAVKGLTYQLY